MNLRQIALAALAALALGGASAAESAPAAQVAQATPAPAVTVAPATAAPSASPAPRGRGRNRAPAPSPEPSPSESPEPPQFSTMDGVWEVQVQPMNGTGRTFYSHLYVTQKGDTLSGTWVRDDKTKVPFTGTFDGRLFKITAGGGTSKETWTMSGYAENFSDMVGLVTTSDPKDKGTPFTASHRKKERMSA